jgi:hypothetical protein
MKKLVVILWCLLAIFISSRRAEAVVDPLRVSNNRFGIHILEADDIGPSADLVNSNGGEWGYVTLVMRQNDLQLSKWQEIFNTLRRLKLIPLVRLATQAENGAWIKPNPEDTATWVNFLNQLNWVTKNRYVILFNEPNHANEWGGSLNPQEYAKVIGSLATGLKASSSDFFILPAALDTAAPNSKITMEARQFWQSMYQEDPQIFKLLDGWNSHSYPNPNFSASPTKVGLGSLQSYKTEIAYLQNLGLPSNLPVFITETGWIHEDGKVLGASDPQASVLSQFYSEAFASIWTDKNLVAITPFVLNYPEKPFSQFSFQKPGKKEFYPHYYAIQSLPKVAGNPEQVNNSELVTDDLPDTLIDSSDYQFSLSFKNTGQSIWNRQKVKLAVIGNLNLENILVSQVSDTEPGQTANLTINLTTPANDQPLKLVFQLTSDGEYFGQLKEQQINILPPPNLLIKAKRLFFKPLPTADDYRLLIYDTDNRINIEMPIILNKGQSGPLKLYGIVPDRVYRLVLLKPYFLPRQKVTVLEKENNLVEFPWLIPLDLNQDGRFSLKDFIPKL